MKFEYPFGATPLEPEDIEQLIPTINTQDELNSLEKINIQMGLVWAEKSRLLKRELLTYSGLLRLHKELFSKVWKWAGKPRPTEKNSGVAPHQISSETHKLCEDVKFWILNQTYDWDEIGVRFHHRLVFIHPFVNGNGRHSRIATDLLLMHNDIKPFSWGAGDLTSEGELRKNYITSLKDADKGDFLKLMFFVRS